MSARAEEIGVAVVRFGASVTIPWHAALLGAVRPRICNRPRKRSL